MAGKMENTQSYSGLFIINPEMLESVEDVTGKIKAIINDNSGEVVEENVMGKKALSYPISKKSEGIYYEIVFNAKSESIVNIMRQCNINTNIMRTLIDKKK